MKSSHRAFIASLGVSAVILALSVVVTLNRQFLSDTLVGMFYEPTASVRELNDRVTLTDDGTRIFYATQPEVSGPETFNSQCPRQELRNPILGCYASDDRIYIFDVQNSDLSGIEEVTAAHEMLHAVWYRMGESERAKLAEQLVAIYHKMADGELKERMSYYERTEPGEFANELHSIIGTEIADIDPVLEKHYARYFERRSAVVDYYRQYDSVYTALLDRAEELKTQIEALASKINSDTESYNSSVDDLSLDIDSFNTRADNGDFTSESAFNRERAQLVARSNKLEQDRLAINADIVTYNVLYQEYSDVSSKIESLDKSLDSFQMLQTAPSL